MSFAKREMAWGKLDAKDIDEIFTLFRNILIPLIGMSTITDIFERIAERRGWVKIANSKYDKAESWEDCGEEAKEEEKRIWNEIMKTLHEPFEVVSMHIFPSRLNFTNTSPISTHGMSLSHIDLSCSTNSGI
jgi:hypothetical protein